MHSFVYSDVTLYPSPVFLQKQDAIKNAIRDPWCSGKAHMAQVSAPLVYQGQQILHVFLCLCPNSLCPLTTYLLTQNGPNGLLSFSQVHKLGLPLSHWNWEQPLLSLLRIGRAQGRPSPDRVSCPVLSRAHATSLPVALSSFVYPSLGKTNPIHPTFEAAWISLSELSSCYNSPPPLMVKVISHKASLCLSLNLFLIWHWCLFSLWPVAVVWFWRSKKRWMLQDPSMVFLTR